MFMLPSFTAPLYSTKSSISRRPRFAFRSWIITGAATSVFLCSNTPFLIGRIVPRNAITELKKGFSLESFWRRRLATSVRIFETAAAAVAESEKQHQCRRRNQRLGRSIFPFDSPSKRPVPIGERTWRNGWLFS